MPRLRVATLAAGMLVFGTINTVTVKYQDLVVVGYGADGSPITFQHPVVQVRAACVRACWLFC
jgi:hypothetical protein